MRKYISILKISALAVLFFVLFTTKVKAQGEGDGINFRPLTLQQALVAAKKENKAVFLHGFADWCHFCMYMHDSVYPKKDVGDFYNANFVCIKMDMEKEGAELNKTLKASTFPLLVYFDSDGDIMHRAAGRKYKQPFLDLGKEALDPKRQMRYYRNGYQKGTLTPAEVQYYFRMQEVAGMDAQLMLNDYLMNQPDSEFTNANNWRIMYDIVKDPTMSIMKRYLGNKKALEAKYTPDSVNNKLINLYNTFLMHFVQLIDSAGYEAAKKRILSTQGLDIAQKIVAYGEINKMKMKDEWPKYKIAAQQFIEKYAMDDSRRINDVSSVLYERFYTDKELVKKLETWVLHSVSQNDLYKGNALLANISVNLGKKEQALKAANHAVELGKRYKNDYSQIAALIPIIEKMP